MTRVYLRLMILMEAAEVRSLPPSFDSQGSMSHEISDMLAANFLGRVFSGQVSRRRNLRSSAKCISGLFSRVLTLESRTLLAGNVTANLILGDLHLVGDSAANDVKMIETSAGMIVQGRNGTTINGAAADFVAFQTAANRTGGIVAWLRAGNDQLHLDGIELDGSLVVLGGTGNDLLGLIQSTIHGGVVFVGWKGNDTLFAEGSTLDGTLTADMGKGNDLIALTDTQLHQSLVLVGGAGADRVALDGTTVDHWLIGFLNAGDDDVRLANGTQTQHVQLWGGSGADLVQVSASSTTESFLTHLGRGDDALSLEGSVTVENHFVVLGGPGADSSSLGTAILPATRVVRSFQNSSVDAAFLTARIDHPTTGLLAAVQTARNAFIVPITTTVTGDGVLRTNTGFVSTATTIGLLVTGASGQTVEIDKDGDGFDDGTTTLGANGTATVQVLLSNTSAVSQGLNSLRIRQLENDTPIGQVQTLAVQFTDTLVVRVVTSAGLIDIELFPVDAPVTTQNFLNYLARYEGSILHRSARTNGGADFIIQGGGFDFSDPAVVAIATDAPIANEFQATNSNVRGTLAMALPANSPNAGTSQWFINNADNSFLDSARHTVFGRVIGSGMDVADAIHALPSVNLSGPLNNPVLDEVPLDGYTSFTGSVAGTVSVTTGNKSVSGVGTQFNTALRSGAAIQIDGVAYLVNTVISDTLFTITTNATVTVTNGTARVNTAPLASQYVQVHSVTVLPQLH